MTCPWCRRETKKGAVTASGGTPFAVRVVFYPQEEEGHLVKKQAIPLTKKAEGYYCEHCHAAFACFEEEPEA